MFKINEKDINSLKRDWQLHGRFWYIFGVSDTVGQHVTFRIRSFPAQISLIRSVMLLLPTLLQGSRLALGRT